MIKSKMRKDFISRVLLIIVVLIDLTLLVNFSQGVSSDLRAMLPLSTAPESADTAIITILASGFSPNKITIKIGTEVSWKNRSGDIVSINSDPYPTNQFYPPLNLGEVNDQESISLTLDKPGVYQYHNHYNPKQTGTITVE